MRLDPVRRILRLVHPHARYEFEKKFTSIAMALESNLPDVQFAADVERLEFFFRHGLRVEEMIALIARNLKEERNFRIEMEWRRRSVRDA